ncbi:acyltransferase family protein [Herbaspirillum frisingense]|uniref:acyltransferase family protein n=1 Tax=Herbaspirillum frisingense TaxID=92645 RepID=UPI0023513557|nr:acyltransferase [Herbaspirillum frisingense]
MGLIRVLLALAVVGSHFSAMKNMGFVGGEVAVEAFFTISGFYMAMVIGKYESVSSFWKSRYLRLYPTYFVCAFLSFLLVKEGAVYFYQISAVPLTAAIVLLFTNITIFFQDVVMFLAVQGGHLVFTSDFSKSTPPLYSLLFLAQGWSLGSELTFYILAPFLLVRSDRWLWTLAGLSLLTKVVLAFSGLNHDPWTYRFFPAELAFFLLGSLSYRIYSLHRERLFTTKRAWSIYVLILLAICLFQAAPVIYPVKRYIFYVIFIPSLGFIFDLFKKSKLDTQMGMLSYPLYCSHTLVLSYFFPVILGWHPGGTFLSTWAAYGASIGLALVVYWLVEVPAERFRHAYIRKKGMTRD